MKKFTLKSLYDALMESAIKDNWNVFEEFIVNNSKLITDNPFLLKKIQDDLDGLHSGVSLSTNQSAGFIKHISEMNFDPSEFVKTFENVQAPSETTETESGEMSTKQAGALVFHNEKSDDAIFFVIDNVGIQVPKNMVNVVPIVNKSRDGIFIGILKNSSVNKTFYTSSSGNVPISFSITKNGVEMLGKVDPNKQPEFPTIPPKPDLSQPETAKEKPSTIYKKAQAPYEGFVKFITSNCNQSYMNIIESELMKRTQEISKIDFNPSEYSLSAGQKNSKVIVFHNKNADKALVIATIKPEGGSEMTIANVDHKTFDAVEPILYVPETGIFVGIMSFVNHTQVVLDVNNVYAYITFNSIKYKQKRVK